MKPIIRKMTNTAEPSWLLTLSTFDVHLSVMLTREQVVALKVEADMALKKEQREEARRR